MLSKLEIKKKIALKLVNIDKKKQKEDFLAIRLYSNLKIFFIIHFQFFYIILIKYLDK